ncbi:MAG: insulinase family protein, partial [Candidatus Rokubacteria bacterium]|nr:insulinase family protein [Candidatus Rokubacteria bacterium]
RTVTRDLTQATVYLGRPAVRQDHPDYYPLQVASYLLGGGSASRLYRKVREEAGLAYWVGSHLSVGRYGASLLVSLQTRTDGVAEALRLIKAELARTGRELVSEPELALAKAYLRGSFPLRMDTSSKLANLLVTVEEFGLGLDYPDRFSERIEKVTAVDVLRVARAYLDPLTFSVARVGKLDASEKSP